MKKALTFLALVAAFAAVTVLTGCDPEKIGGGGQLQPYNPATGQYK